MRDRDVRVVKGLTNSGRGGLSDWLEKICEWRKTNGNASNCVKVKGWKIIGIAIKCSSTPGLGYKRTAVEKYGGGSMQMGGDEGEKNRTRAEERKGIGKGRGLCASDTGSARERGKKALAGLRDAKI